MSNLAWVPSGHRIMSDDTYEYLQGELEWLRSEREIWKAAWERADSVVDQLARERDSLKEELRIANEDRDDAYEHGVNDGQDSVLWGPGACYAWACPPEMVTIRVRKDDAERVARLRLIEHLDPQIFRIGQACKKAVKA